MSFDWFRMWTDAVDDEKLKLLAFEDRWHFVAILCCKRKGILDAPDAATMRDRKVGAKLGLADRERDEVRRRLMDVGLVDENWQPLAWGKRQFISDADPTATERKRRQRKKGGHARVTRDIHDSHAPVTDESRSSHAPQTQTQTTDSEKNQRVPTEPVGQKPDDAVARVFDHWRSVHGHQKATLDPKRRRVIRAALESYSEADLCQAITGYKNSPHHMGQNDRATVYDDIELMLRDSKHIEAGLKFHAEPPRTDLSSLTRRNVAATADWVPPEMRSAAG